MWIGSAGARGFCPEWYTLIQSAKYLGVAPWDLARQPVAWQHHALAAQEAESWGGRERGKRGI